MRKRMLIIMMAAAVGISAFPMGMASANPAVARAAQDDDEDEDWDDDDDGDNDDDDDDAYELTKGDIIVKPAKKTIKVRSSFNIDLRPSDEIDDEYADLPEEEWEEFINDNIDSITYRSKKSSIASVSKKGKVKGKKKGSTVITTTVTFRDGSEGKYKTTVYVTR